MPLSKPLNFVATSGDASVLLQWSPVLNATRYEIQVKNKDTWDKKVHCTETTYFMETALKNGTTYLAQVIAMNETRQSEPSTTLKVRPKSGQPVFSLSAKRGTQRGRISLKWTTVPTNAGYKIERCNAGDLVGYKCIATIQDKNVTTYEDTTDCDASQNSCAGHYYTISTIDATWLSGAGILSKKVFCLTAATGAPNASPPAATPPKTNPPSVPNVVPVVAAPIVTPQGLLRKLSTLFAPNPTANATTATSTQPKPVPIPPIVVQTTNLDGSLHDSASAQYLLVSKNKKRDSVSLRSCDLV